ncbi:MAG: hypothetical protein LBI53_01915 [Candidatus Peribacteria bacterium]|jgi:hypothetical protein|nr:hypothetical protein [Candidatus Peribacteria bacterium]
MHPFLQKVKKFAKKQWIRFSNYNNSKKWFVLYLILLCLVLLFPPIVKISGMRTPDSSYSLLFSGAYIRSLIVILVSIIFLLGWNISISFKSFMIRLFSLREDEPLVDFAFLWVITSVFMGIADTVGVAQVISERISLTSRAFFSQILLFCGLVWSFVMLWISAKKKSKATKILNIVEEQTSSSEPKQKKHLQHLFDDLEE